MTDSQKWLVLTLLVVGGWLVYLLAPVLTPFLIAALLAYLGDPLADRLEAMKLSRSLSVITVFTVIMLSTLALVLVLLPMLERQISVLVNKLPVALIWLQENLMPRLESLTGIDGWMMDAEAIRAAVAEHWQQMGSVAAGFLRAVTTSGQAVLTWAVYAFLVPVVTFYLLRDWDILVAEIHNLVPRRYESKVAVLARECDSVLAEFLRGQLLVMLVLGTIYTVGLWIAGLDLAFLAGMLAGVVSFVPYLGVIVGIAVAGVAAVIQFQDAAHLIYVLIVFGIGQGFESMVLSPLLVGDRIGLHPVAVIFAVMAGGQLFGFFGVLLALPVAAVIVVLLRHSRELYIGSDLYTP